MVTLELRRMELDLAGDHFCLVPGLRCPQRTFANNRRFSERGRLVSGVYAIAFGDDHACVLLYNSDVECWGHNRAGQLGDGTTNMNLSPVLVVGL
jgi:alpha-tubulin suppressor-like RCC1 family protein